MTLTRAWDPLEQQQHEAALGRKPPTPLKAPAKKLAEVKGMKRIECIANMSAISATTPLRKPLKSVRRLAHDGRPFVLSSDEKEDARGSTTLQDITCHAKSKSAQHIALVSRHRPERISVAWPASPLFKACAKSTSVLIMLNQTYGP